MRFPLIAAVALLAFANGANDNFKGVATLWGAGRTTYRRALAWATVFTFLGSLTAVGVAGALAAKFNGSKFVGAGIYTQPAFLAAVVLGAAATVLLAARLGLPISTTHALTGAIAGAGIAAAGLANVQLASLASGVLAPLLFSPVIALGLTLAVYPLLALLAARDCVCVDEPATVRLAPAGLAASDIVAAVPQVRWASTAECQTGVEVARWRPTDSLHWLSSAAISFARGLNDTPKIVAVLLILPLAGQTTNYVVVALTIALGGLLGAQYVARTMSKKITPMATPEAVSANLVAAALVTLASPFGLPVSTTHVTNGGIFGIGLLRRRQADWGRVRGILLSWLATLPLGAALAVLFYRLLMR